MSRIKWEAAKQLLNQSLGGYVGLPDRWPERMDSEQLARLQCRKDANDRSSVKAFKTAIDGAINASELPNQMQQFTKSPGMLKSNIWGTKSQTDEYIEQCRICDLPAIAPDDFAMWLRNEGETPSAHIQAWFDAMALARLDTQPQALTVVAAPVVEVPANSPLPVTTGDIAHAFDGLRGWNEAQWKKPLGDKPKWLVACIAIPGIQGVSETRWNPVLIGAALVRDGHAKVNSVRSRFQTRPQLMPWLDAWKTYEADNLATA